MYLPYGIFLWWRIAKICKIWWEYKTSSLPLNGKICLGYPYFRKKGVRSLLPQIISRREPFSIIRLTTRQPISLHLKSSMLIAKGACGIKTKIIIKKIILKVGGFDLGQTWTVERTDRIVCNCEAATFISGPYSVQLRRSSRSSWFGMCFLIAKKCFLMRHPSSGSDRNTSHEGSPLRASDTEWRAVSIEQTQHC